MEDFALRNGLQLDGGESLLFAMAVHRGVTRIVTGDKRAIQSLEILLHESELDIGELENRLVCFEQLLAVFVEYVGANGSEENECAPNQMSTKLRPFASAAPPERASNFDPTQVSPAI